MKEIRCPNLNCSVPNASCHEGHLLPECPYYATVAENAKSNQETDGLEETHHARPNWTSLPFTPVSASVIMGVQKPFTIGIVGFASAGKTSFLSTLYLRLKKQEKIAGHAFAGSLTLLGWETISANFNWKGIQPPTYPPRTTGQGREPGLLHLALRNPKGQLKDMLLTDVPGEWFFNWVHEKDGQIAEGAHWVVEHSDALLLLIDGEALSGQNRHTTKRHSRTLINRLKGVLGDRPFAVVWTKKDATNEEETAVQQIQADLKMAFGDHAVFHTIAAIQPDEDRGQDVIESVAFLLQQHLTAPTLSVLEVQREERMFRLVEVAE